MPLEIGTQKYSEFWISKFETYQNVFCIFVNSIYLILLCGIRLRINVISRQIWTLNQMIISSSHLRAQAKATIQSKMSMKHKLLFSQQTIRSLNLFDINTLETQWRHFFCNDILCLTRCFLYVSMSLVSWAVDNANNSIACDNAVMPITQAQPRKRGNKRYAHAVYRDNNDVRCVCCIHNMCHTWGKAIQMT